ncbi:UNVERIFIED_CONTAM: Mitochondrial inner membrane protein oxa1l [Siphonaria sp. JEL0065]|nr:Mitochondrial inner membrane protein oxa1l [Siphonaria sp. JEL0065]
MGNQAQAHAAPANPVAQEKLGLIVPVAEAPAVVEPVAVQTAAQTSTVAEQSQPIVTSILDPSISTEFSQNLDKPLNSISDIVATSDSPALTAITQIGDLQTLGLGGWSPVGIVQSLLEAFYVTTGLPWWATIAISTIFLRLALFPFVLKAQRVGAKMNNLKPILQPLQEEMKALGGFKADPAKRAIVAQKLQAAYKAGDVNPFGGLWGVAQMPVFISMFFGLRGMAELPVPGFTTGGFLWFNDLSMMDPTYILPVVANGTMLVVMEYGMEMQQSGNPAQAAMMKKVFRFMLIGSMFFMAQMPAAVFVYWVTSNFLTLIQFFALKNVALREFLNIPRLKTFPNETPVKGLSAGISPDGMLAVKPMKFGEAWSLAKDEAERRKKSFSATLK